MTAPMAEPASPGEITHLRVSCCATSLKAPADQRKARGYVKAALKRNVPLFRFTICAGAEIEINHDT